MTAGLENDTPRQVLEARRQAFNSKPVQEVLPSFLRMLVDPLGRIWLQDYPLDGLGSGWTVLNADGALLGRVELPRPDGSNARDPVQLVEVLEDRVALKWQDNDGAVHLGYFKIERP